MSAQRKPTSFSISLYMILYRKAGKLTTKNTLLLQTSCFMTATTFAFSCLSTCPQDSIGVLGVVLPLLIL